MTRTFIILAALAGLIGCVIGLAGVFYDQNIAAHPTTELCGWVPGDAESKPCRVMP
jgi:hypothetical protein